MTQEPLVIRRIGFTPINSLLMPAFSLVHNPPEVTRWLHLMHDAPLPNTKYCRGFGGVLEPHYIVGAGPLDQ